MTLRPPTPAELEAERRTWVGDTEHPPPDPDHPLAVAHRRAALKREAEGWTLRDTEPTTRRTT